ncbi:hypothetical protein DDW09_00955 [Sulfolobus sp. SCGC AB-777_L09]|nr:hypothetical protein DDW09_00955 [Sulfolobus sp. SCGC AB-777_L09]
MKTYTRDPIAVNLSQLLIFISILIIGSNNYLNYLALVSSTILLILAGLLLVINLDYEKKLMIERKFLTEIVIIAELSLTPLIYFLLTHNLFMLLYYPLILFGYFFKKMKYTALIMLLTLPLFYLPLNHYFGTDEIMIGYYSAYLFLHGFNPYNPHLTANVYEVFSRVDQYIYGTPYTTGGFVTNLNYPALFFLIELPAVIFSFSPDYILLLFYLLTGLVMLLVLPEYLGLLFISAYLLNFNYLYYPLGGVDDIVWVFFLLLTFLVKDVRLKGVFYGLSISYKQDPILALPFILFILGKEKSKVFLVYAITVFLIINSYFIFLSPYYYFHALTTPISGNIIPIGYGITTFSFTGLFYIYPLFFTIAPLTVFVLGIILRVTNKWPAIAYFTMFLMSRVLWNYLVYWPFFSYVEINEEKKFSYNRKSTLNIIGISILFLIFLAMFFHFSFLQYSNSIHMELIKVFTKNNQVYGFLLNVSYIAYYGMPSAIKPNFRILQDVPTISGNGLIWLSNTTVLKPGEYEIVYVYAPFPQFYLNEPVFITINAYYGDVNGFLPISLK